MTERLYLFYQAKPLQRRFAAADAETRHDEIRLSRTVKLNKHNPHVFARSGAPERTPPSAENFRESAAREITHAPTKRARP